MAAKWSSGAGPQDAHAGCLVLTAWFSELASLVTLCNRPIGSLNSPNLPLVLASQQENSQTFLVPCINTHRTPVHPFRGTSILQRALTIAQWAADFTSMTVPDSIFLGFMNS